MIYLRLNSTYSPLSITVPITLVPDVKPRWNYTKINNTLNAVFGYTPFRSYDHPTGSKIVPWVDIVIFVVFLFIIFTFSGYNAAIAGIGSGGWFVFAGAMISGAPWVWVPVGIIIMIVTFLYVWGDTGR